MDCARICRQAKRLLPRILAALGLLLLSAPALAGEVYSFVQKGKEGDNLIKALQGGGPLKGRLLVDGPKYRIEYGADADSTKPFARVSKDGGEHEFYLDVKKRTYFEVEKSSLGPVKSSLFHLIPLPESRVKGKVINVKLEVADSPELETISGIQARRHEVALSYDLAIEILPSPELPFKDSLETVHGRVKVNAVYWMAEDRAPLPVPGFRPEIRTGFPQVDNRLAGALAALRGLMVKEQVTIASEGDRGITPQSETSMSEIAGPRPQKTQPAMFEVPSGFKYHKPEITRPEPETPHVIPPGPLHNSRLSVKILRDFPSRSTKCAALPGRFPYQDA